MIEVEVELEGRRFDEEERLAVEGMTLEDDVGTLDEEDDIDDNDVNWDDVVDGVVTEIVFGDDTLLLRLKVGEPSPLVLVILCVLITEGTVVFSSLIQTEGTSEFFF